MSVVIINWNHGHCLGECLPALLAQDYARFDVTILDNHSTDGSPEWVARNYPAVRLRRFDANCGFAVAFNHGARLTAGPAQEGYVLSLNPDVVVRPGFMRELVQASEPEERIGVVAPKLLRGNDPTRLDSTGLFIDRRRRPYDRGQGELDCRQYDRRTAIFGACGAAALYRRAMLEDVALAGEYMDASFFAYYEDADLAWRAQLRGWHAAYAPLAVAIHARGWGDTLRKGQGPASAQGPRLALRNRYLMTLKNDAWKYFLLDLPLILAAEAPRLVYAGMFKPKMLLGLCDLVRLAPQAWRKRQLVRHRRTVADATVRQWFLLPAAG